MTLYKVAIDHKIEAKNANAAYDRLFEDAKQEFYFDDYDEAENFYLTNTDKLSAPKYLGNGMFWFDGGYFDSADGCEKVGTLAERWDTATSNEIIAITVREI